LKQYVKTKKKHTTKHEESGHIRYFPKISVTETKNKDVKT